MNHSGCDGMSCQGFVAVAHLEKKRPVIQQREGHQNLFIIHPKTNSSPLKIGNPLVFQPSISGAMLVSERVIPRLRHPAIPLEVWCLR